MGDLERYRRNNLKLPPSRQIHLGWDPQWRCGAGLVEPCSSDPVSVLGAYKSSTQGCASSNRGCWWDPSTVPHSLRKSLLPQDMLGKDSDTRRWGQSPCRSRAVTPLTPGLWKESPPTGPISPSLRVNFFSKSLLIPFCHFTLVIPKFLFTANLKAKCYALFLFLFLLGAPTAVCICSFPGFI